MARRRKMTGTPLLVAGAAALISVACGGRDKNPPMGNLMPPPERTGEVCVDTVPDSATVQLNGRIVAERCTEITSEGLVEVAVTSPGYMPHTTNVQLESSTEVKVELVPVPPDTRPVGNLMPPPDMQIEIEKPE